MDFLDKTRGKKIMALDVGTKTIGVAISDALHLTANPITTIQRKIWSVDAVKLADIARKEHAGFVVIGLPLNMDGSKGPRSQAVNQFAKNFAGHPGLQHLPIHMWDERLSTEGAYRELMELDISHSKISEKIDAQAAAYILQGFLDFLRLKRAE